MSNEILITGATGDLGRVLCALLNKKNIPFTAAGRKNTPGFTRWRKLDLQSGEGLENVLDGINTVIHLASATRKFDAGVDVSGTLKLLPQVKQNKIHLVFISIVGTDSVPMKYYRIKWETEKIIQQNFIDYSIVRATQFHNLIDRFFSQLHRYPILVVPKNWMVQPIDVSAVAGKLLDIALHEPTKSIENLGGSQVLISQQMMKDWLHWRNSKRKMIAVSFPGKASRAVVNGSLTCLQIAKESSTWNEWLKEKYQQGK